MEKVICDFCGSAGQKEVYTYTNLRVRTIKDDFTMDVRNVACEKCGLVYQNPRMSKKEIDGFYAYQFHKMSVNKPSKGEELVGERSRQDQFNYIVGKLPLRKGKILDVGSFEGYFLSLFRKIGWEAYGVDPHIGACQMAKRKYGLGNIYAINFEESNFDAGFFDLITISHVLEHVRKPSEMLKLAHDKLKEGGYLFIQVPNVHDPFSNAVVHFFSFQHLYSFSPVTLRNYLKKYGFKVLSKKSLPYSAFRILAQKRSGAFGKDFVNDFDKVHRIIERHKRDRERAVKKIEDDLRRKLKTWQEQGKRIALFGAGMHTQHLLTMIGQTVDLVGLIDDDNDKIGQDFYGYRVYSLQQILEKGVDAVVISSYAYQDVMYERIKGLVPEVYKLYNKKIKSYEVSG